MTWEGAARARLLGHEALSLSLAAHGPFAQAKPPCQGGQEKQELEGPKWRPKRKPHLYMVALYIQPPHRRDGAMQPFPPHSAKRKAREEKVDMFPPPIFRPAPPD